MPSDIHDPSPAKARRLRIVRTVIFWTALLLFLAGIIGGLAVAVWEIVLYGTLDAERLFSWIPV